MSHLENVEDAAMCRQCAESHDAELATLRAKLADVEQANRMARDLCAQATERADALQSNADLRYASDQRAIERWQAAHPGHDLRWPDRTDLCVWLCEQLEEARKALQWEHDRLGNYQKFERKYPKDKWAHCLSDSEVIKRVRAILRAALDAARKETV